MSMIGEKGKLSEVDRVIEVKMYDNFKEKKKHILLIFKRF